MPGWSEGGTAGQDVALETLSANIYRKKESEVAEQNRTEQNKKLQEQWSSVTFMRCF